jgi:hypothetical protein
VVKWLQSYGLTVTQTYSNHLLADASGTCGFDYCNDQIYQTVTLPIAFSKVTLGYWYYSDTRKPRAALATTTSTAVCAPAPAPQSPLPSSRAIAA